MRSIYCLVIALVATCWIGVVAQESPGLKFDVASVKPNDSNSRSSSSRRLPSGQFEAVNLSLGSLIQIAYGIAATQKQSRDSALDKIDAYMADAAANLPALVATERYEQTVFISGFKQQRKLISDFGLIRLLETGEWIGFREVLEIDDKRTGQSSDGLRALLLNPKSTVEERARSIMNGSAQYNLGQHRDLNNPAIGFAVLDLQNRARFRFSQPTNQTLKGVRVMQMSFQEVARPTIVRTSRGADVPLAGYVVIDGSSGRPMLIQINTEQTQRGRLRLTFEDNREVNAWVPSSFEERYTQGEVLESGTAQYTNYRRFLVETNEGITTPAVVP